MTRKAGWLLVAVLVAPRIPGSPGLAAQSRADADGLHRFVLVPLVGPSWNATRFEGQTPAGQVRISPASGLALGAAFELRVTGRVALAGLASWSSLAYEAGGAGFDGVLSSRNQDVVRMSGGVTVRVRETARGYFAAGVATNRFRPAADGLLSGESPREEWGGYGGLGLDFNRGNPRFRVEWRATMAHSGDFQARFAEIDVVSAGWALDWLLLAGVAVGF